MAKSATGITGPTYAGLDVSLKETAVCIVDDAGNIVFERMVPTDPGLLASCLAKHAPGLERFGIESGATSAWLWREFRALGLPVVCLDSRHAHRVLSMKRNKNDRNGARSRRPRAHGLVSRGARAVARCPVHPVDAAVAPAAAAIPARGGEPDARSAQDARSDDRPDERPWVHAARRRAARGQRLA